MSGRARRGAGTSRLNDEPFVREVVLLRDRVADWTQYPFSFPAVSRLEALALHPKVTLGENGSGKSTLIEAIAAAVGLNPEGGSQNLRFSTAGPESNLHELLRIVRGARRPRTSFFLRAESFFNVATVVDQIGVQASYGGRSLHEQSHGESFLALVTERFGADGLYLLDEPEAALSPQRQLSLLAEFDRLVRQDRSQVIVATHSPILLAYPNARIYALGPDGLSEVQYEQTEHYSLTRDFLLNRDRYLRRLFGEFRRRLSSPPVPPRSLRRAHASLSPVPHHSTPSHSTGHFGPRGPRSPAPPPSRPYSGSSASSPTPPSMLVVREGSG